MRTRGHKTERHHPSDRVEDSGSRGKRSVSRYEAAWYVIASVLYCAMQATSFTHDSPDTNTLDALDYAFVGHQRVFSGALLAGIRPPVFPLFWKALRFDTTALLVAHVLIGAVAWLGLAWQTRRLFRTRWIRMLAFVVVLLVGLSPQV